MQDEQLVSNLRNKGRFSRLSALKKLAASEDFKPEQNRKANFNFHCRTEYSCFGSTPSLEAYRLMKNGFPAVAIVDYASLSGAKELMKAEKILGGLYYIGAETDVEDEKGAPVRMISMGIPHKNVKAFNFDLFFYRKIQNDFTDQLLGKLNSRLKKYGITVSTPPRSFFKTTSTEDVFVCLADAIIEKFRAADKITAFITQDLGISLSEYDEKRLEDTANVYYEIDLAATLFFNYKMKLPPRKLKKVSEFVAASNGFGAISALVMEGDEDEAIDFAVKNGIRSVVFNIDKQPEDFDAKKFYDKCIAANILPIARMVCDYPKKKLVREFGDEETASLYRETTFAVIGHEISSSLDACDGMFSGITLEHTPSLKERIRLFSRIGLKGSDLKTL